jgi:hypothetical protein
VTTTLEGTSLHVRTLSTREHLAFLLGRRASSFLQWPSWGEDLSIFHRLCLETAGRETVRPTLVGVHPTDGDRHDRRGPE